MEERLHDCAVTAPCGDSRISGRCEAHEAFSVHDQAATNELIGTVQILRMAGPKHLPSVLLPTVGTLSSDITLSGVLWC